MSMIHKLMFAAAVAMPAMVAAAPAQAQVSGIAVADPQAAVQQSNAWKTAVQQIQTTYAAQLSQAQSLQASLKKELDPLVQSFETARRAPNANEATLRTQAQTIQQKEAAGNQQLATITMPVQRARSYALEQITAKLGDAVNAVVQRKKISLLLQPGEVLYASDAANVTNDIATELNRVVPNVSIAVPANWQPGQAQQQQAQPASTGR